MELDNLSLKELRDLKAKVDKAISTFDERRKREAVAELEDIARRHGFSLSELTDSIGVRKRGAIAAKYANPDNPQDTWSGRGRKPRWALAAIENGKSLEDLAI